MSQPQGPWGPIHEFQPLCYGVWGVHTDEGTGYAVEKTFGQERLTKAAQAAAHAFDDKFFQFRGGGNEAIPFFEIPEAHAAATIVRWLADQSAWPAHISFNNQRDALAQTCPRYSSQWDDLLAVISADGVIVIRQLSPGVYYANRGVFPKVELGIYVDRTLAEQDLSLPARRAADELDAGYFFTFNEDQAAAYVPLWEIPSARAGFGAAMIVNQESYVKIFKDGRYGPRIDHCLDWAGREMLARSQMALARVRPDYLDIIPRATMTYKES